MQPELLRLIVGLLDTAQIPHMVAGSFASTYHGEPRMTRDIDLVVDPTAKQMKAFAASLNRDRFYMPEWSEPLQRRSMINLIDTTSGWKFDLIFRKHRAFSESEFGRRQRATISGIEVYVATVEDTILAKLERAKSSGSERQLDDVRGMLRAGEVDRTYLAHWVAELNVAELWSQVNGPA